jgi:hypothetical protein
MLPIWSKLCGANEPRKPNHLAKQKNQCECRRLQPASGEILPNDKHQYQGGVVCTGQRFSPHSLPAIPSGAFARVLTHQKVRDPLVSNPAKCVRTPQELDKSLLRKTGFLRMAETGGTLMTRPWSPRLISGIPSRIPKPTSRFFLRIDFVLNLFQNMG